MRAIINGVRYDTDKADFIGEASFGYGSDFRAWEASLYVTPRSGRYFLAGSGGPASRYRKSVDGNSWSGGSAIHPLSRGEALEWAEEHLSTQTVEEHFGDIIEDA